MTRSPVPPPWLVLALGALGLAVRVLGLVAPGALLQVFPTEDGYLMLQVARNMALGLGMSTAAGTIPTNGVQPLSTLLFAGLYALVDGDRTAGVALVMAFELLVAVATALALAALGRRLLAGRPGGRATADLAAAAWFASPVALPHTMNALESGFYALLVLLAARAATALPAGRAWPAPRVAGVGALLGLVFLARNDGVFFVLAVTTAHLASGAAASAGPWRRRLARPLAECVGMGLTSILVASPWLVSNVLRFGSMVPVSGQSEAMHVEVADTLYRVPPALLEVVGVVLPIPAALELRTPVILLCAVLLVALACLLPALWRASTAAERRLEAIVGVYGVCLLLFYGLFFGAPHFMARYLFPLSPFFALLGARVAVRLWPRLGTAAPAAAAALLLVLAGVHARALWLGRHHPHFHVVRWVERHVPDDVWVGAVQTGTLGYFHDRTLNLDGKVNPEALEARRTRSLAAYILASDIQVLADWRGIVSLHRRFPGIAAQFRVVVDDRERDLGVLVRRGAPLREPVEGGDAAQPSAVPTTTRLRPRAFASYKATSAAATSDSGSRIPGT